MRRKLTDVIGSEFFIKSSIELKTVFLKLFFKISDVKLKALLN